MDFALTGVLWYVAFLFSTTLHEASHAFLALKLGDPTAHEGGHVTLNPLPHIRREPIGTVVVPFLSYLLGGWMIGWASVPYDPDWALQHPKRAAQMALAGPAANLLLVLLLGLAIRAGIETDSFVPPETINFTRVVEATGTGAIVTLTMFVNVFFSLNLLLFIFNLLPIPPLDGSGMVPLFLSDVRARQYLSFIRNPSFAFLGLIVAWRAFDYVYPPFHLACINVLYAGAAVYR